MQALQHALAGDALGIELDAARRGPGAGAEGQLSPHATRERWLPAPLVDLNRVNGGNAMKQ